MVVAATEFTHRGRRVVAAAVRRVARDRGVALRKAAQARFEGVNQRIPAIFIELIEHLATSTADLAGGRVDEADTHQCRQQPAEKRFGDGLSFVDRNQQLLVVFVKGDAPSGDVQRHVRAQSLARVEQVVVAANQPVRAATVDAGPVDGGSAPYAATLQSIDQGGGVPRELSTLCISMHGNRNRIVAEGRGQVGRGANPEFCRVGVGAPQRVEHDRALRLSARVVVECDAEKHRFRGRHRVVGTQGHEILQPQCKPTEAIDDRLARRRITDATDRCADFTRQWWLARQRGIGTFEDENLLLAR